MLGMPLQGMAETLSAVFCLPHMHGHASQVEHDHDAMSHDHSGHSHAAGHQQSDPSDVGGAQGSMEHACCPIVVSGLPPSVTYKTMSTLVERALPPEFSRYVVFLKHPQRPPLA